VENEDGHPPIQALSLRQSATNKQKILKNWQLSLHSKRFSKKNFCENYAEIVWQNARNHVDIKSDSSTKQSSDTQL